MTKEKAFKLFSGLTLIFSLLVVLAGALVKATGAGMGCPDWPKCYGYWVPPMEEEQVMWSAGKHYGEGVMVIHNHQLFVALHDISNEKEFSEANWEEYKKHDYAEYKARHTITEYLNRLCGAILGIMAILMLYFSISYRKTKPAVFWGSIITLILILFEGYLGAKVVDSNLKPLKISIHLYFAFLILIAVVFTRSKVLSNVEVTGKHSKLIHRLLIASLLLLAVQLFLGSNVREAFDHLRLNLESRDLWVDKADWIFLSHRTFTWLYGGVTGALIYLLFEAKIKHYTIKAIAVLIALNIVTGVIMGYFAVPQFAQPIHLVFASLLLTYTSILLFAFKKSSSEA